MKRCECKNCETANYNEDKNNRDVSESKLIALLNCMSEWVVKNGPKGKDHACVKCFPKGGIVVDGFICTYHKAIEYRKTI
jgi:hypothetical protein